MRIFKNKNFTKRNYDCTNIVACEIVEEGAKVPDNYEAADEAFGAYVRNLTPLWIESGVRYYGYL